MADLTITAADVAAVQVIEQYTGPSAEAVERGQPTYFVAASGKLGLADENNAAKDDVAGVAVTKATNAGDVTTIIRKGIIDLGDALDGMNYDAIVYLSATAGKLADADPGNTKVVGRVIPGWGATTADKLLRVDL